LRLLSWQNDFKDIMSFSRTGRKV